MSFAYNRSTDAGADLGYSRGGGGADFQKEIENFDDLFFLVDQIDFFELSQSTVLPLFLAKFSAPQTNF